MRVANRGLMTNRFIVVSQDRFHPELKSIAGRIDMQKNAGWIAIIGYPSMGYIQSPILGLWAPICVTVHHAITRSCYKSARVQVQSGKIVINNEDNSKFVQLFTSKRITRFHFNFFGDLVFHLDHPLLSRFKGISLIDKPQKDSLSFRIRDMIPKSFSPFQPHISYTHLEEDVRRQVDHIISARQWRFRVATSSAASIALSSFSPNFWPLMTLSYFALQNEKYGAFSVAKQTNALWNLIYSKGSLKDIIKPEYQKEYPPAIFDKNLRLYVSTLGNICFAHHYALTLRDQCYWAQSR